MQATDKGYQQQRQSQVGGNHPTGQQLGNGEGAQGGLHNHQQQGQQSQGGQPRR